MEEGELAKPNMYFAAALITFAAKTPTANERGGMTAAAAAENAK